MEGGNGRRRRGRADDGSSSPARYIVHPVSRLDTLAGVAIKYGVEVRIWWWWFFFVFFFPSSFDCWFGCLIVVVGGGVGGTVVGGGRQADERVGDGPADVCA